MYNLCILSSHFYPVKSSCSDLFRDLIRSLLKNDIKITIITISGTKDKIKTINTKKINYIGIKNSNLQSPNNYKRVIGDIISIFKIKNFYRKKNFNKFDQVLIYSPSIFWSILLLKLNKELVSIKMGDLYPKWLLDHKIISKFSVSYLFLKFFELLLYMQADKIFVQTKKDLHYFSNYKKIFNFETDVIYNWINTSNVPSKIYKRKNRKHIRFIFAGVVGIAQDYKLLFRIIEYLKKNNLSFTFYFIGSGNKKKDLRMLNFKNKNVFFFPEMHLSKLDKIIQKCDICVSTLSKNFKSDNFPGKILRYMTHNKPMIVHSPKNDFLKNLIKENSLGVYSSNEKDLFENIDFIFSNFNLFEKNGKNGLEIAKKYFSCDRANKILFKEFKKLS